MPWIGDSDPIEANMKRIASLLWIQCNQDLLDLFRRKFNFDLVGNFHLTKLTCVVLAFSME